MVLTSTHRKIRRQIERPAHRRRSTQDQKTHRTPAHGGHGFLTDTFRPVMELQQQPQDWQQMEKEFFDSLTHLCQLYQLAIPDVSHVDFPFNIAVAFKDARDFMKEKHPKTDLLILQDDTHKACVATSQTFSTGRTLFYISIYPLFVLSGQADKKSQADLLLSIFAYLHQIAGITFYNEDTFVGGIYDRTRSWIFDNHQEWDKDTLHILRKDFRQLFTEGKKIAAKAAKPLHLRALDQRCQQFVPTSQQDEQLLQVATRFSQLFRDYPKRSINTHMLAPLFDCDPEETIYAEGYISFVWRLDDLIADNVNEMINMYFQETIQTEEPTVIQWFDEPQSTIEHDLGFEQRLFDLLHDLADVLTIIV